MLILVKLIGLLILGLGIVFLLNPQTIKKLISYFRKGKKIYLAAVLRLLFGLIFLSAFPLSALPRVIYVFGVLFLASGTAILILGPRRTIPILDWYNKQSVSTLRFLSLPIIALGILIFYSA